MPTLFIDVPFAPTRLCKFCEYVDTTPLSELHFYHKEKCHFNYYVCCVVLALGWDMRSAARTIESGNVGWGRRNGRPLLQPAGGSSPEARRVREPGQPLPAVLNRPLPVIVRQSTRVGQAATGYSGAFAGFMQVSICNSTWLLMTFNKIKYIPS